MGPRRRTATTASSPSRASIIPGLTAVPSSARRLTRRQRQQQQQQHSSSPSPRRHHHREKDENGGGRGEDHHHHDNNGDDDSSSGGSSSGASDAPAVVHFPRRFPRLGGAFQAKTIPELLKSSLSVRPAPLKLSLDVPHCTEVEVALCATSGAKNPKGAGTALRRDIDDDPESQKAPATMMAAASERSIISGISSCRDSTGRTADNFDDPNNPTTTSPEEGEDDDNEGDNDNDNDDPGMELPSQEQQHPVVVRRGGRLVHSATVSANNKNADNYYGGCDEDRAFMLDHVQRSFYNINITAAAPATNGDGRQRQQQRLQQAHHGHTTKEQQEAWVQEVLDWWRRRNDPTSRERKARSDGDAECSGPRRTKSKYRRKDPDPDQQHSPALSLSEPKEPAQDEEVQRLLLRPRPPPPSSVSTEQEEFILSYLHERHGGQVQQAVLGWQVDWTGGGAVSALRRRKRRRDDDASVSKNGGDDTDKKEDNDKEEETEGWPVLLGDYRNREAPPSVSMPPPSTGTSGGAIRGKRSKPSNDNSLELYKAVLAIGKSLQQDFRGDDSKQVVLTPVLTFLHHAQQLPALPLDVVSKAGGGDVEEDTQRRQVLQEFGACLSILRDSLQVAEKHRAVLLDLWHEPGVDPEALSKQLEIAAKDCDLEGMRVEMKRQLRVVAEWQTRVEAALNHNNIFDITDLADVELTEPPGHDLSFFEELLGEAATHGIVSKGYLFLRGKLQKAYHIRDKMQDWRQSERLESLKFVAAIVRDLGRLKILFPEACALLVFHRQVESWIDRANVAIRSRISLAEIYALCESQEGMQVDLSDYVDKLRLRAKIGQEWLDRFKEVVIVETEGPLEWLRAIREVLQECGHSELHELASEGSRIPVEVDCVKLLQVELDAKSWTLKAKKWLPTTADDDEESGGKKAKLEDLEEHMEKATALRDRLSLLSSEERDSWILEGESELRSVVEVAETWFDKYDYVLDGDNRRNSRARLSLPELRQIVQEADAVYVNLASAGAKVSRLLAQAEKWYEAYYPLLAQCGLLEIETSPNPAGVANVALPELIAAVAAAKSDLSIDLEEAVQLADLTDRIRAWFDSAGLLAGGFKRQSSRQKQKKGSFSVERLKELIEEASTFPVDMDEERRKLKEQLETVEAWQARAANDLEGLLVGFQQLRESINETYREPSHFTRGQPAVNMGPEIEIPPVERQTTDFSDEKKAAEDVSHCETSSSAGSEQDLGSLTHNGSGDCNVHLLIKQFMKEAFASCIETPEREIASELDSVWCWCIRSLKYLDSQRDVFDKRFFGAFDRFITEGNDLSERKGSESLGPEANTRLRAAWGAVVTDQLERLNIILTERKRYVAWCKTAEQLVFCDGRKISIEKLRELSKSSREFPPTCDMIKGVRDLEQKASSWITMASESLSSGEKLSMNEAKTILEDGDKLGVVSNDLKALRNSLKSARGWANRVKRCKPELGNIHVADVKALLEEYDSLIVEMPEELDKLQHAVKNYCICRRPYDGFMIGCDTCEEWFHGPCIGVSESRAGKVDKYACIRCSVSKVFDNSASIVVGIIRKWTSDKDRRKARQLEAQRHQRKVRKEKREVKSLMEEQEFLKSKLLEAVEKAPEADDGCTNSIQHPSEPLEAVDKAPEADDGCTNSIQHPSEPLEVVDKAPEANDGCTNSVQHPSEPLEVVEKAPEADGCANSVQHPSEPLEVVEKAPEADGCTNSVQQPSIPESCETAKDADMHNEVSNDSSVTANSSDTTDLEMPSKQSLETRLQEIANSLEHCEECFTRLEAAAAARRNEEELEDANAPYLKSFCMRARSRILVPSSSEQAERSLPLRDGTMSKAMVDLIDEANQVDLLRFKDVAEVVNAFKCLSWSMRASSILTKQPCAEDVQSLVEQASELSLPDEKALRMMKTMAQRAKSWKNKVAKAITPAPGETKPFDVEILKGLASIGDDIPFCMPIESRLLTVIEDNGGRHCLCGGPSDGRFMLSCDSCDRWFHGHCVNVSKEVSEGLNDWKCPPCAGTNDCRSSLNLNKFHDNFDAGLDSKSEDSSLPSDVKERWPPYGLFGSPKAVEALGDDCSAIADDFDVFNVVSNVTALICAPPASMPAVEGTSCQEQGMLSTATGGNRDDLLTAAQRSLVSGCSYPDPQLDANRCSNAQPLYASSAFSMVAAPPHFSATTTESSQETNMPTSGFACKPGVLAAVPHETQSNHLNDNGHRAEVISAGGTNVLSQPPPQLEADDGLKTMVDDSKQLKYCETVSDTCFANEQLAPVVPDVLVAPLNEEY